MSFRKFVPLVAILAVFTMALRFSIGADTYWHLRIGDWILSEGSLPRLDPFSLTRFGAEWIYPGWLAQIGLILTYQVLGFPGLNLLTALTVAATFGTVWATMEGRSLLRAFVILFAATASAVYWAARPHIFTLFFTSITLWSLAKYRRTGSRAIWIIPPLTALWANVHGGFVIPILLIGLEAIALAISQWLPKLRIAIESTKEYAIRVDEKSQDTERQASEGPDNAESTSLASDNELQGDRRDVATAGMLRTLVGVGLASAVAVLINPFGIEMLAYPLRTVSIGVLQDYIQEWQSPNFHQLEVQPFLWLLLLVFVGLAVSPKRPKSIELIHVGVFAYISFLAARNVPLFALVAAPALSRHLDAILLRWLPARSESKDFSPSIVKSLNVLLLIFFSLAALVKGALPLTHQFNADTIAEGMPAKAVDFIQSSRPQGPLLNSYNWGGYILWRLYPHYLSFVDGRTDLFDDAILEEYLDVWRGNDGWESSIQSWGIRTVLIESDAPLAKELHNSGWTIAYEDDQATVFTASD